MAFADRFHGNPAAQRQFADRQGEQVSFDASLNAYSEKIREIRDGAVGHWLDFNSPRRNVLVYYGVGGIGKTTLLKRLADRMASNLQRPAHWPLPAPFGYPLASCSIDMGNFAREDAFLLLRAAVAELGGGFPATDLCFSAYWSAVHPDSSIIEAFKQRGRLAAIASSMGVSEHIQAAMQDVCSSILGTSLPGLAAFRLLSQVGSLVWKKQLEKTVLASCDGLVELLEDATDPEKLGYLAYALAWDLENLQRTTGAGLVVFVDTMEAAGRGAEAFLNTLIWMMPNALFVVAGRNALTWADDSSGFEFWGKDAWPGLSGDSYSEPRQHLVGYLSMQDRLRWLKPALDGVCSEDVIQCTAKESKGLPVHLDLILQHVLDVSRTRDVTVDDVRGDLDTVARRVLRDLTPVQRRALLAASLFRRFDIELVRVAADLPNCGPVDELCRRPYVDKLQSGSYGFRLHDVLRDVFVSASGLGDDQWLPADWMRAASRSAGLLHDRLKETTDPLVYKEHAELLFELVDVFGFDLDWLSEVAARLTALSNWSGDWSRGHIPALQRDHTWSMDLSEGVAVVMARQGRDRGEVADRLAHVLAERSADSRFDVLNYFLAQALRDAGDVAESRRIMQAIVGGDLRDRALKGLIHLHRREGNFIEAEAILDANPSMYPSQRLLGEIRWVQGRLPEALRCFDVGADDARRAQDGGETALCLAYQAWCAVLEGDVKAASGLVEEARQQLRSTYQDFASLVCLLTEALASALRGEGLARFDAVETEAFRLRLTSIIAYSRLSACLAASATHDDAAAVVAAARLSEAVDGKVFAHLGDLGSVLAGLEPRGGMHADPGMKRRWLRIRAILAEGARVG